MRARSRDLHRVLYLAMHTATHEVQDTYMRAGGGRAAVARAITAPGG
jgi:hypothetical protein